ncbi:hypothetical protein MBT84_40600 [Streptomyces sp. MBT84]|nr:hypothetical protein [Streptomyces sp. MBT84]
MTDRTTAARGDTRKAGFDRRLVPPMMLGSVLNPINSTIVAVALVPIGAAFGRRRRRRPGWSPPSIWPPPSGSRSSAG